MFPVEVDSNHDDAEDYDQAESHTDPDSDVAVVGLPVVLSWVGASVRQEAASGVSVDRSLGRSVAHGVRPGPSSRDLTQSAEGTLDVVARGAVVLHLGPVLGRVIDQELPAVVHRQRRPAVNLHTGGRPAGPRAGAEAGDVVVSDHLVAVLTREGRLAANPESGEVHDGLVGGDQGRAQSLLALGRGRLPLPFSFTAPPVETWNGEDGLNKRHGAGHSYTML